MLILLSPSKGQDFEPNQLQQHTQPVLLKEAKTLVQQLKTLQPQQIAELMSVSENLAELNHDRYQRFKTPLKLGVAKQAALAFKGDVYTGLEAESMSDSNWDYAQKHLRILSGLYGYLRPLDLILPYRLEMKTKLSNPKGENLYQFWDTQVTELMNKELNSDDWVVNLASNEYYKAVKPKLLKSKVVNIDFKDTKAGKTRIISYYAKTARGMLARAMIDHQVSEVEQIKSLSFAGYRYRDDLSKDLHWVFERPQPAPKK
jgi:cytoplasmic iron level regulating protein YaaA (DUF328/UPF0246 family)